MLQYIDKNAPLSKHFLLRKKCVFKSVKIITNITANKYQDISILLLDFLNEEAVWSVGCRRFL